jgi:ribose 5-phosphate isomerase B
MSKKLLLASDHAAYPLKNHLVFWLKKQNYEVIDLGTESEESADYSDFGHKLGYMMDEDDSYIGIALCGSGTGMNMTISKHKSTRSALCWNVEIAKLSRQHNDANVLVLPGRFVSQNDVEEMVRVFLDTPFEGGRHERRINKIPLK